MAELPRYRPTKLPDVSAGDRARIEAAHFATDPAIRIALALDDEFGVPRYELICAACHEQWVNGGCSTRRALARLAMVERIAAERGMEQEAALQELGRLAGRNALDILPTTERYIRICAEFEPQMLLEQGIRLVDYQLGELRLQLEAWLKEEREKRMSPGEKLARDLNHGLAHAARRRRAEEENRG